jgi:hypothetical protein
MRHRCQADGLSLPAMIDGWTDWFGSSLDCSCVWSGQYGGAMKTFLTSLLPVFLGFVLVIGVTAVQGLWTERWGGRDIAGDLARSGRLLEERFPKQFGDWRLAEELESDPVALAASGAVAHIARSYENSVTGAKISAFVVCATPHDASGHTPDRCYPGAGFEIAETEHRQAIPLADGRKAETFTGTFRKTGETLRVFWTYGLDNRWVAPQIARIELAGSSAVYKLYAIINETRLNAAQSKIICADFLSHVLPEFDKALLVDSSGAAGDAAVPPAADGPPDEKGDERNREAKPEGPAPPAAESARA